MQLPVKEQSRKAVLYCNVMAENTNHNHLIIGGETWKEQLGELPAINQGLGGTYVVKAQRV
jgi:hypothetical protein